MTRIDQLELHNNTGYQMPRREIDCLSRAVHDLLLLRAIMGRRNASRNIFAIRAIFPRNFHLSREACVSFHGGYRAVLGCTGHDTAFII